jgi:lipopolysaccharide/colanic/teichoic acid biosynthesis glycosyltransferase
MDISRLHDQFWAAHGVQVVRTGEPAQIRLLAGAFLLLDSVLLALFDPARCFDKSGRNQIDLSYFRLHDAREQRFRERVVTDEENRFVRFERHYEGGPFTSMARVLMTPDPRLAAIWQMAPEPSAAAHALRQIVPRRFRAIASINGRFYDPEPDCESQFTADLIRMWPEPDGVLERPRRLAPEVWADPDAAVSPGARVVGPVWIGAGRRVGPTAVVAGPVVLWDDPFMRPTPQAPRLRSFDTKAAAQSGIDFEAGTEHLVVYSYRWKRAFDIIGSVAAILVTLPLYPIILLAIWMEDGRPFFFVHRRESLGGRKFPCLKFRSMKRNAEKDKQGLAAENDTDGPQFFMQEDPRVTRVGAFLRHRQLDELPQFFNVFLGHMSLVGPRPSPYAENQFCPSWREARLSVRPGITGLWQVERKRAESNGFQEWIKYDIEYVQNAGFIFDLKILWRTAMMFLKRLSGHFRPGPERKTSANRDVVTAK